MLFRSKARKARYKLEAKKAKGHAEKISFPISKSPRKKPNNPQKCGKCGIRGHFRKNCETKALKLGNPEPQEPSITQPLVQETSKPETQPPKVDFEPIYDRPKKEVKVDDLQRETKETRSEIGTLKQNLQALQKTQSLESTSYQSNEESPSDNEVHQTANPRESGDWALKPDKCGR